jgi:hypothetical protein
MGSFALVEVAIVVFAVAVIGLCQELARGVRADKARRERVRLLRPVPPAVSHTYSLRGLGQWNYQVVKLCKEQF